jgi:hypothetical protein
VQKTGLCSVEAVISYVILCVSRCYCYAVNAGNSAVSSRRFKVLASIITRFVFFCCYSAVMYIVESSENLDNSLPANLVQICSVEVSDFLR